MTRSPQTQAPAYGLVHVLCVITLMLSGGLMLARAYTAPPPVGALSGNGPERLSAALADATAPTATRIRQASGLPPLTDVARQRLAQVTGARRLTIQGRQEFSGEHDGLIVLEPGAELVIDELVLRGAIVSSAAVGLDGEDGAPASVSVRGRLRIDPMIELPGLAVYLPTGSFMTDADTARFQIDGDVIAEVVEVHPSSGEWLGRVAAGSQGRGLPATPRTGATDWSPALSVPAPEVGVDGPAEARAPTTWNDVQAMLDFDASSLPLEQDR